MNKAIAPALSALTLVLGAGATPAVLAQAASGAAAKPPAKAAVKAAPAKGATASTAARKARLAPAAVKAVEEVTPIDDDPSITLTEAQIDLGRRVFVGDIPCELGATVKVAPARRDGFFMVTTKGHRFLMHAVESRTGALRLEDAKRGALWLQLGNKSMLMSQKLGQRLADECQSADQLVVAQEMKTRPPVNLLEPAPAGPPSTR
jgi:hypothetical protein